MARIPDQLIQTIKSSTNIVDYIGQYTSLHKRGKSYSGSCPFHEDRNPSFSVLPDKQIFNCFSCQRKGDIFRFVMEMEGFSYPQAIAKVAEYAGVAIDPAYQQVSSKSNRYDTAIYQIHSLAAAFYAYYLTGSNKGKVGMDYLASRHLDGTIIENYQIGLAPQQSKILADYLQEKGYGLQDLVASGIFYQTDQQELVDRFKGRLIFPLRDKNGQVVGFSGRVIDNNDKLAKYVNSPETEIFQKSKLLFNLDKAKDPIRKQGKAIVCEGFMDVLRLESLGIHNGIATMGTALTSDHLQLIQTYCKSLIFLFDGDEAGQKATYKAYQLQDRFPRLTMQSVKVPGKLDPDEWALKVGSHVLADRLDHPESFFDFYRDYIQDDFDLDNPTERSAYIEKILAVIALIPSAIERQMRIASLSQDFDLPKELLNEQVAKLLQNRQSQTADRAQVPANEDKKPHAVPSHVAFNQSLNSTSPSLKIKSLKAYQAERLLLSLLIHSEEAWTYIAQQEIEIVCYHDFSQKLYFALASAYYDRGLSLPMTHLDQDLEGSSQEMYLRVLVEERNIDFHQQIILDCLARINEAFLEQELTEWLERAKSYQVNKQTADANEAMAQVIRIKKLLTRRSQTK